MADSLPVPVPDGRDGDVTSSLSGLVLDSGASRAKEGRRPTVVADSWEDEEAWDPYDEDKDEEATTPKPPSPPPPTPAFPSEDALGASASSSSSSSTSLSSAAAAAAFWWEPETQPGPEAEADSSSARRPDKTDAVARRMIAAGLGIKAPKQSEDQKAYQKALLHQEKKRRELEKEEERRRREDAERAKAAVWND